MSNESPTGDSSYIRDYLFIGFGSLIGGVFILYFLYLLIMSGLEKRKSRRVSPNNNSIRYVVPANDNSRQEVAEVALGIVDTGPVDGILYP